MLLRFRRRNTDDQASNGSVERRRRGIDTGNHFEFFGSSVTVGPDWKSFLASLVAMLAPAVIFMIFVAPWLGQHLSWALFVISILIILATLAMLFATALVNPGFLPRDLDSSEEDLEWGRRNPSKEHTVNNYVLTTKWCTTCNHYRPPRCSHCAVCDNCVDKFDHHCPWVGTCIGRRNYRFFISFVFLGTLLCAWVFALSLVQLLKYREDAHVSFGRAIGKHPASLVTLCYTFLFFWFVGGLSGLHIYFCSRNMTTYEHFRHRDSVNPYNRGLLRNWVEVFCIGIPTMAQTRALPDKVPRPGEDGRPMLTVDYAHLANGYGPGNHDVGAAYRQPLPGEPGYSYQTDPYAYQGDGVAAAPPGLGYETSRLGPQDGGFDGQHGQPFDIEMAAAAQQRHYQQQQQGRPPDGSEGSTAAEQPSETPATYGPSSGEPQTGYGNGIQSPRHDLDSPDNGGANGSVSHQRQEPLPGTVLDTAGGDEDVVAVPAAATGKVASSAPRREDGQQPTAAEAQQLSEPTAAPEALGEGTSGPRYR